MENRLAGQHSGDRRRRRMSADLQDAELFEEFFPNSARTLSAEPAPLLTADAETQLLRRLISPTLWKHVLLLASGIVVVATVLWWERVTTASDAVSHQSLSRGLTGLLLLLSGQLALLTGWLRTDSEIDFQGRYRWWKWLAAGYFVSALAVATNSQSEVSGLIASLLQPVTGSIRAAKPTLILIPGMTYCIIVLGRVLPDMSRCLPSQSLLVMAVLTMIVRLMLQQSEAGTNIQAATFDALLLTSAYVTFASMLLHCRFVAYISNDPPLSHAGPACASADTTPSAMSDTDDVIKPAAEEPAPVSQSKAAKATKTGRRSAKRSRKAA